MSLPGLSHPILLWLFTACIAILISYASITNDKHTIEKSILCEQPNWKFRVLNYDPFIAHIEDFMTESERRHIMNTYADKTSRSEIVLANGSTMASSRRTSSTSLVPRRDPIMRCVMKRAADIQGFIPLGMIENPQLTYYSEGQEYKPHTDWGTNKEGIVTNRETTIFAILDFDCFNCGTTFPLLEMNWQSPEDRWCDFFECKNTTLTTKPVLGSALFWRNVREDGRGDVRVIHAGLPVAKGFKAGLNIWTKP